MKIGNKCNKLNKNIYIGFTFGLLFKNLFAAAKSKHPSAWKIPLMNCCIDILSLQRQSLKSPQKNKLIGPPA